MHMATKRDIGGTLSEVTSAASPLSAVHDDIQRNPGTPLNLDWIDSIKVNLSAVERRVAALGGRRTYGKVILRP